jgi:hypothetical protein
MLCLACKLTVLLLCIRSTAPAAAGAASPATVVRIPAATCLQDKQQQMAVQQMVGNIQPCCSACCKQHSHEAALIHEAITSLQVHPRSAQGSTTLWNPCEMLLSLTHLQQLRWHHAVLEALLLRPKHRRLAPSRGRSAVAQLMSAASAIQCCRC